MSCLYTKKVFAYSSGLLAI